MPKKVKVKFKYYQVREMIGEEITERIYDLQTWVADMSQKGYENRLNEINDVKGRLEDIKRFKGKNIYALNFMRFDEVSTSYILKEVDAAEHIDLDRDEYIAKNTVCIYDADRGIIIIQTNRGGYSERTIQSYINSFLKTDSKCAILPIKESVDLFGADAEYMKLDLRLANLSDVTPTGGSDFERILDGMLQLEGVNAHIELSLGNERKRRLNAGRVRNLLKDLVNNRGCVTSARVKLSEDQISGVYDLFDTLCQDMIECDVDQTGGIAFEYLAEKMNLKYSEVGVKNRLDKALS